MKKGKFHNRFYISRKKKIRFFVEDVDEKAIKLAYVIVLLLLMLIIMYIAQYYLTSETEEIEQCYVGVAFCGNTAAEAKLLIDRVKSSTNLFVLQSGPISTNETATTEICDYAVASGLNIIV